MGFNSTTISSLYRSNSYVLFFWTITTKNFFSPPPLLRAVSGGIQDDQRWSSKRTLLPIYLDKAVRPSVLVCYTAQNQYIPVFLHLPCLSTWFFSNNKFPKWFNPCQKYLGKIWLKPTAWWYSHFHKSVMWLSLKMAMCSALQSQNRCRNGLWTKV